MKVLYSLNVLKQGQTGGYGRITKIKGAEWRPNEKLARDMSISSSLALGRKK